MKTLKLSKRQMDALHKSHMKWILVAAGLIIDTQSASCQCCKSYGSGCLACPIKLWTGQVQCFGTPYEDWTDLFNYDEEYFAETKKQIKAAKVMADFIQNILDHSIIKPARRT